MTDPSPRESDEDFKMRLDSFFNDPVILEMKDKVGYLPIWGMMGAAISFLLIDYGIKTNRFSTKSPMLARFGTPIMESIICRNVSFKDCRCLEDLADFKSASGNSDMIIID